MKKLLLILLFLGLSLQVYAKPPIIDSETNTIEMLNKRNDGGVMIYSVDIARVGVGESITWLPTDKMHNVEMKNGPDGAKIPKKSKFSKEFTMEFSMPGIYVYVCTPHAAMGMMGIIIVGDDISNKEAISNTRLMGKSKKRLKVLLDSIK